MIYTSLHKFFHKASSLLLAKTAATLLDERNIRTEFFHIFSVHLGIIKSFIYPTECTMKLLQNNVKTFVKIYIKSAATCFGLTTIIRELTVCTLLKL
jgi:hypothetical protein